ncbi:MAG: hypothetical protein B7733_03230 [Myxococcales bacterium FL481]|nr:MAG: hypothetical protein B7733_03230 [Myxococcales bacterium FL481]
MVRRCRLVVVVVLLAAVCYRPGEHKKAAAHPETFAPMTPAQRERVDSLIATANAAPTDFAAHKQAGLTLMELTLSGAIEWQNETERLLERAYELNPSDDELNRVLGRFYNMRAVEHDFRKASWQKRVYASLLGDQAPVDMTDEHFVAYSFFALAQIIELADRRKLVRALSRLRRLERELEARVTADPANVELRALAGNFALFFAGYVPVGQKRRIDTGIGHFEFVRSHWSDMRPGARDPRRCPNTYENFMFELGEALLARDRVQQAQAIYEELATIAPPATRAKELIAAVSRHRLAHLDRYRGRLDLMPPWPSDVGNCVVCHSYTGDLPVATLVVDTPIDLTAIPTTAAAKPLDVAVARPVDGYPADQRELADVVERRCGPCHFTGGRASGAVDLLVYDEARTHADWVLDAVESGDMPPERPLSPQEVQIFRRWATSL